MDNDLYGVREFGKYTAVIFRVRSLMNPTELEQIRAGLLRLVDVEKRSPLVLDFHRVQFLSSQLIGVVLTLHKKLKSELILCGVSPQILELLKITRLDRLLTIKPTLKEAVATE